MYYFSKNNLLEEHIFYSYFNFIELHSKKQKKKGEPRVEFN